MMSSDIDFLQVIVEAYREEAESRYDYTPESGEIAAWGALMICAKSDNEAKALAEDMRNGCGRVGRCLSANPFQSSYLVHRIPCADE